MSWKKGNMVDVLKWESVNVSQCHFSTSTLTICSTAETLKIGVECISHGLLPKLRLRYNAAQK